MSQSGRVFRLLTEETVLAESNVMNDSGRMTKCVKINMVEIFLWNMNQFSG